MPLHKDLTGSDLHEPKGAFGAAANTTYFADGSGSGSWRKIVASDFDSSLQNPNTIYMSAVIPDISTASSILLPIPDNMTLQSARLTLGAAITVADSVISFVRNDGSSMGATVTIAQSGSAEGSSSTFTATTNQLVTGGGYVKVSTDGGSTGTVPLFITFKFTRNP